MAGEALPQSRQHKHRQHDTQTVLTRDNTMNAYRYNNWFTLASDVSVRALTARSPELDSTTSA